MLADVWYRVSALLLTISSLSPGWQESPPAYTAAEQATAASLRGHVSFLASDLLEGRDTPSRGLEIAAEYIAAQFRRAGLEPVEGSYFQTAPFVQVSQDTSKLEIKLEAMLGSMTLEPSQLRVSSGIVPVLSKAPLWKVDLSKEDALQGITAEQLKGVVVTAAVPKWEGGISGEQANLTRRQLAALRRLRPGLLVLFDPNSQIPVRERGAQLRAADNTASPVATVLVRDASLTSRFESMPVGEVRGLSVFTKVPAAVSTPVALRNVVGLLPGSDAALKDSYLIVSAHYDHVGVLQTVDSDRINNGANDDASGVSSMVELAALLSAREQHPRRSVLFMAYFGEEKGLFGSIYYASHPLVPLAKTVANLNLEQTGRSDATEGPQKNVIGVTGYDFTNLPALVQNGMQDTPVRVTKDEQYNEAFFSRSDNQSLANLGVPAHTFYVALNFEDYHRPGDEWEKLDYNNMSRVTRALGQAIVTVANSDMAPEWNKESSKTEEYRKAREKLTAAPAN